MIMSKQAYLKLVSFAFNSLFVVLGFILGGVFVIGHLYSTMPIVHDVTVKRVITEIPQPINTDIVPRLALDTYIEDEPIEEHYVMDKPKTMEDVKRKVRAGAGVLTADKGVTQGLLGKETWYNLDMDKIVQSMRNKGYSESEYPYSVRDDGVKCLGDYVIVAADLSKYPRGTIVETSLGQGIVCDTGDFVKTTDVEIDIATTW